MMVSSIKAFPTVFPTAAFAQSGPGPHVKCGPTSPPGPHSNGTGGGGNRTGPGGNR